MSAEALSQVHEGPVHGEHAHRTPTQAARIEQAEAALARLDTDAALALFQQAADQEHAADIELGLVRAHLQAGDYRRAMGLAAHTAGAHGHEVGGVVLYAWLLHLGGQGAFARQLLSDTARRLPGQALLLETRRLLDQAWPTPSAALLNAPLRLAPYGGGSSDLPALARVVGTGVVVDGGKRVLVALSALQGQQTLWIRHGLGLSSGIVLERRDEVLGLALCRLLHPMPVAADTAYAMPVPRRDPFPGSPSYTVGHALTPPGGQPAWPLLSLGLTGSPVEGRGGLRHLGAVSAGSSPGSPIFDAAGRFWGMALPAPSSQGQGLEEVQVPLSMLKQAFGDSLFGPVLDVPVGERMPVDEVYERSLRTVVQVLGP